MTDNKENTIQVKVALIVEVDAAAWADYHRIDQGLDQTLRVAVTADVKDYFNDEDAMNEKMGEAFKAIAKIV